MWGCPLVHVADERRDGSGRGGSLTEVCSERRKMRKPGGRRRVKTVVLVVVLHSLFRYPQPVSVLASTFPRANFGG